MYKIGFIGCGNMGGALARAVVKTIAGAQIAVCDYDAEKAQKLANEAGMYVMSAEEVVKNCHFVVLGVKPQHLQQTLAPLAPIFEKRTDVVVISMAAGTPISTVQNLCGGNLPVIRIMPNTPVLLGEGMTVYATDGVSAEDESEFLQMFAKSGSIDKVNEEQIDAVMALSSCGPAFVYAFAQALAKGAEECGAPKEKTALYAAQTLQGAAKMLMKFGDAEGLKRAVCSPGGTTIAGLNAMDEADFDGAVQKGVQAAYKRALELK